MALVNEHFLKLPNNYFFSDIEKKVNLFRVTHPKADIIRLGTGDVTLPLPPACIEAMHKAIDEMGHEATFTDMVLKKVIIFSLMKLLKTTMLQGEYIWNLVSYLSVTVAKVIPVVSVTFFVMIIVSELQTPSIPVYIDSNVSCGRAGELQNDGKWSNVVYMPCLPENNFIPQIPSQRVDIVYLCYPNNPTGTVLSKNELKKWVNYALQNDTLIIFDAAYEAYIQNPDIPHSIYEIKGAKKVAIECRSFSKTAGFTGVRCGYMVIPKEITAATLAGKRIPLNPMWKRHQEVKFNGTSYITQRGAEAIYTPEGKEQVKANIRYYMDNVQILKRALTELGLRVAGGEDAPYLWVQAPNGMSSWKFFDKLLYEAHIVGTPGIGFGPSGEGYMRFTGFGKKEDCKEAIYRLRRCL